MYCVTTDDLEADKVKEQMKKDLKEKLERVKQKLREQEENNQRRQIQPIPRPMTHKPAIKLAPGRQRPTPQTEEPMDNTATEHVEQGEQTTSMSMPTITEFLREDPKDTVGCTTEVFYEDLELSSDSENESSLEECFKKNLLVIEDEVSSKTISRGPTPCQDESPETVRIMKFYQSRSGFESTSSEVGFKKSTDVEQTRLCKLVDYDSDSTDSSFY